MPLHLGCGQESHMQWLCLSPPSKGHVSDHGIVTVHLCVQFWVFELEPSLPGR